MREGGGGNGRPDNQTQTCQTVRPGCYQKSQTPGTVKTDGLAFLGCSFTHTWKTKK